MMFLPSIVFAIIGIVAIVFVINNPGKPPSKSLWQALGAGLLFWLVMYLYLGT